MHSTYRPRSPHTHIVEYVTKSATGQSSPVSFRTTKDALRVHRENLTAMQGAGIISSLVIKEIKL